MNIEQDILMRSLVNSTLETVASDYRNRGYEVEIDKVLDGARADLFARKGDQVIIFEIKAGPWSEEKRQQAAFLKDFVSRIPNGQFKLLFVPQPGTKSITVEGLDGQLLGLLREEEGPSQDAPLQHEIENLKQLASNVVIDTIYDIDIQELTDTKDSTEIAGTGFISVRLEYGSPSDQSQNIGMAVREHFPIRFRLSLDQEKRIRSVLDFTIDVSSFTG